MSDIPPWIIYIFALAMGGAGAAFFGFFAGGRGRRHLFIALAIWGIAAVVLGIGAVTYNP